MAKFLNLTGQEIQEINDPPTYQETDRDREILLIWLQDDDLKGNMNRTGAVRVFKSPVIRKQDLNCKQPFEILEKNRKKLFRFDIIEV